MSRSTSISAAIVRLLGASSSAARRINRARPANACGVELARTNTCNSDRCDGNKTTFLTFAMADFLVSRMRSTLSSKDLQKRKSTEIPVAERLVKRSSSRRFPSPLSHQSEVLERATVHRTGG